MPILNIELAEYRTLEKRAESAEEREKKLSVEEREPCQSWSLG